MPKRGNEHAQVAKEDLDAVLAKSSSDEPKGPFERASAETLKKRKIVKLGRKFAAAKRNAAPSNSIFSSVSLSNSNSTAVSGGTTPKNAFGNFSFGAPSATKSASTKAVPFFGAPGTVSTQPSTTTATTTTTQTRKSDHQSNDATDEQLSKCTQGFLKHMKNLRRFDSVSYQCFARSFGAIAKHAETIAAATTTATAKTTTTTTTTTTGKTSWDSSRPLFGGAEPLVSPSEKKSPSAATKTTNAPLFGSTSSSVTTGGFSFNPTKSAAPAPATGGFSFNPSKSAAPAPATGGFSFNPTKSGAAAAPVPAFSFSTTPTAAVKAAAKATAASKPDNSADGDDDADKENDADAELGTSKESDDYQVLYKTKTKILHVKKSKYIKGMLKLEKHKTTGKSRLVVRDGTVGTVKMNTAITQGMPLSKTVVPATKKKAATPVVLIKAIFDETSKDELEDFKIITSMEEHENLYNELKKLV